MNKLVTTLLLSLLMTATAFGQDINKVFKDMPRDIIYGLSPELNAMLLDDPADTTKFVATAVYEKVKRNVINSEYIALQTSKAGLTEIRLLPLINGSKIVCVVQTVSGVITDSRITFYTDKWEPLDGAELLRSDLLPHERSVDWFIKSDADKSGEQYEHAIATLIMTPMKYSLSAEDNTLTIEFNPKSFLSNEDYKIVEPYLTKEPRVLKWDKVRFK